MEKLVDICGQYDNVVFAGCLCDYCRTICHIVDAIRACINTSRINKWSLLLSIATMVSFDGSKGM